MPSQILLRCAERVATTDPEVCPAGQVLSVDEEWELRRAAGASPDVLDEDGRPLYFSTYTVPAAATRHVVTDLTPGAGYSINVNSNGSGHTVSVVPGGPRTATTNGVLSFQVTATGTLAP